MSIQILSGGLLTTVQDRGRIGYQAYGISVSGVMDPYSAAVANILVGNAQEEAVLEVTLLGPQLRFTQSNCIAVTGGDLSPALDGKPLPMYKAICVAKGQILSFGAVKSGCRAYIAFSGGLDVPIVMGSRSTNMGGKFGGFEGRKLAKGDELPFRSPHNTLSNMEARVISVDNLPKTEHILRVIMGPQDDMFTDDGIATFLNQPYVVTPQADRRGARLDGPAIQHIKDGNIISDGICFGAIQVPSEGKPIIMLAERHTIGGYAKIAHVISVDFSIAAQLKPGDRIRFKKISIQEAQSLYLAEQHDLCAIENAMNQTKTPAVCAGLSPISHYRVTVQGDSFDITIREIS